MKTADQVSAEKLRGGFYTPPALVDACLSRIHELLGRPPTSLLEPSAGDGAFLRGISRKWAEDAPDVTAVELLSEEARKCASVHASLPGRTIHGSVLDWALSTEDRFDSAAGNPPFVRFQFVSSDDRVAADRLADRLGVRIQGVANLWIPVLFAALSRLRDGGAFSFVVPTECLTGAAAGQVRAWLLTEATNLHLDLFEASSFPGVLQEVALLSGRRGQAGSPTLEITQARAGGKPASWTVHPRPGRAAWTRYLLRREHRDALSLVSASPLVSPLGALAAFEVSIVTGANDYFGVTEDQAANWELHRWCKPLLPRVRHAPGLTFTAEDHARLRASGAKGWILDFASDSADPRHIARPAQYIVSGEARELHRRFKCRIREPWFRVPNFQRGALLMSKRSHLYPRVILNEAQVYTTDTIYRGRVLDDGITATAVAAAFHNSITLLTAELEGRSFGGGVLELVPSEIARLLLPRVAPSDELVATLDMAARSGDPTLLVAETNRSLVAQKVVEPDVLAAIEDARMLLLGRRMDRNGVARAVGGDEQLPLAA